MSEASGRVDAGVWSAPPEQQARDHCSGFFKTLT